MSYVRADGTVSKSQPISKTITDFFWSIINVIILLFSTFFQPTKPLPKKSSSDYNPSRSSAPGFKGGVGRGNGGPRGSNVKGMDVIRKNAANCAGGG